MSSPGRPQHWSTSDADIRAFALSVVDETRQALGTRLIGAYLHGSLAMGRYYRPKSDLDLLLVVRDKLSPRLREEISRQLLRLSDARPTSGDLELSVLSDQVVHTFIHPLPYELHFSESVKPAIRAGDVDYVAERADPDLAAHITVVLARGVVLFGPDVSQVFGPVPWESFIDSIADDLAWIIDGDHIVDSPCYGVLNCCRALQALLCGPGALASKEEGGVWGLSFFDPRHRAIVEQALSCYRSSEPVPENLRRSGNQTWDADALRRFRDEVKDRWQIGQADLHEG